MKLPIAIQLFSLRNEAAEDLCGTLAKVKEMVPAEEVKANLKTRKAVKVIVESAVAVAPKTEE